MFSFLFSFPPLSTQHHRNGEHIYRKPQKKVQDGRRSIFLLLYDMIPPTLMAFSFVILVILAKGILGLWDIFVGTVYRLGYSSGMNQRIQWLLACFLPIIKL